jgi:hypothetical protein
VKQVFAVLLSLIPTLLSAGVVYKYLDKDGNPVYTDQPKPGAERVDLPEPSTYTPPKLPPITPTADKDKDETGAVYNSLNISSPKNGETIWDNTGNVMVVYAVEPALKRKRGNRMVVLVDGQALEPLENTKVQLENVDRGTHNLKARIIDAEGEVLIESGETTFHLHRQSVNFPNRAKPAPRAR